MEQTACEVCKVAEAGTYYYRDGKWFCKLHREPSPRTCNPFEFGHENPMDPKGSTAHVRDIKDRRYHPTEKRMFYASKEIGRSYFFPKG